MNFRCDNQPITNFPFLKMVIFKYFFGTGFACGRFRIVVLFSGFIILWQFSDNSLIILSGRSVVVKCQNAHLNEPIRSPEYFVLPQISHILHWGQMTHRVQRKKVSVETRESEEISKESKIIMCWWDLKPTKWGKYQFGSDFLVFLLGEPGWRPKKCPWIHDLRGRSFVTILKCNYVDSVDYWSWVKSRVHSWECILCVGLTLNNSLPSVKLQKREKIENG